MLKAEKEGGIGMTIRELLDAVGMDRTTVYYYEKEGLIHPARQANGYRDYSQTDLTELQRIKLLRRLGVPLEEIRALQAGERQLPDTLTRRLAELECQQARTARDQDTCRAIRDAGVGYRELDPNRFAAPQPAPQPLSPREPEPFRDAPLPLWCPWRRYFARALDMAIWSLPFWAFVTLLCHTNITRHGTLVSWMDLAASILLTLVLEPVCLHLWGATPGKMVFGLRVENADGTRLTWSQAMARTRRVLWEGTALYLPLVSLWRMYKSYQEYSDWRANGWDREEEYHYIVKPGHWRQNAGFVLGMIGCYGLSGVLALMAGFVPHTGPLTAQQFADNYNFLARYNGDPAYLLQPDGSWAESDPYSYVIDFSGGPLPMTIETGADGFVESVTLREEWDRETFLAFWPEYDMQLVSIAFGAGEGGWWNNWGLLYSLPGRLEKQTAFEPFTLAWGKVRMECQVEIEGFLSGDSYLMVDETAPRSEGWFTFTIRGAE